MFQKFVTHGYQCKLFISRSQRGLHRLPLSDFLHQYFSDDKYKNLRQYIKRFAEGFDLADITKASTISLYNEWNNEGEVQYRINGGYQQLIAYLEMACKKNGCTFYNNCCVKKINWKKNEVNIITMCSRYFKSEKVIITVPLSVLQSDKTDLSYIEFLPEMEAYTDAAKNICFETVIKVILEFNDAFWQAEKKNIGFILMDEKIPTWWTQLPKENAVLTGWLGGPAATLMKDVADEDVLKAALESLSPAFEKPVDVLKNKLIAHKIVNWSNVPHISGGYSYNIVESADAKELLNQPVDETIFFAGEALHHGSSEGTVEAALISGKQAALKVMQQ